MKEKSKVLFIFIDESGNFDFSQKGTKYFVLTSISTFIPLEKRISFLSLRYSLLKEGFDLEFFHATEDKQFVRDKVFNLISYLSDFEIDSIVVQKNKTNHMLYLEIEPSQKKGDLDLKKVEEKFYKQISETLLQYIIRRYFQIKKTNIEKVVIVFGAVFNKRKHEYITKYLKQYLKRNFNKVPYIYFHRSNSDVNCQIADYCGWAIYVKWERNEKRPYNLISDKIKSEFDIFKEGETIYY